MNTKELRNKTTDDLQAEIVAMQKELFNLRMQKGLGQSPQTHLFKKIKRNVARVKTLLREKEGSTL